jgi:KTSC domain
MRRMPVASSSIASLGYDHEVNALEVEFCNGRRYRYFAVPQRVFEELLAAPSKGAYVNAHIKDRFPFTRIPLDSTQ